MLNTKGHRVLIVEDHPDGRHTLKALLELWGHQVQAAGDGVAGAQLASSWRPEVAILDIGLPGLDGYQLAQLMRDQWGPAVRLIALTGYGSPEDRRRAYQAGFDVHLTKPADPDELRCLVASATSKDRGAAP
jgi:CheY-like chemotaxis protein